MTATKEISVLLSCKNCPDNKGGYDYAEMQAFRIKNGLVKDVQVRSF